MRLLVALTFGLSLLADAGYAQQAPKPTPAAPRSMQAARRSGSITIDGKLDEAAWAAAAPSGDFVQSYPAPGKPATDPTEVRVLYDDASLYVAIRMFDAHPDSIAAGLARRDATAATGIYSDWVHLMIDSYHDRRTAFRFSTTPRGVQKDVYTFNDGNEDLNWDAVWEVATRVDSAGWTAEYRIPLSQLRFGRDSSGSRVWGFQVQRDVARRNERDTWSPWTPEDGGFVSRFGDLAGLTGIAVPERLEVIPYLASTITRAPRAENDPFWKPTNTKPKVGGDVRYGLPGGLTLSATINPDFGQVEVDPAFVNLSAFEVFLDEKRPFFLEGSDVFAFGEVVRQNDYGGQDYVYSRRIGRRPQLGVAGSRYSDIPLQTDIAAAAKVTGKTGPWTVGILDAVTPEMTGRGATSGGVRLEQAVEPFTNYFASRLKRDFRGGATTVGAMIEQTSRATGDSIVAASLRSGASFGGIDFEHDMMKRTWVLSGFAGGSLVRGSRAAITATQRASTHYFQRPDAGFADVDTSRTSLAGYISELALQHNGRIFGSIALKASSPGLELNDLGFQTRTGYRALSTLIGRQSFTAGKVLRSWTAFVFENDSWNYDDRPIFHGYAGRARGTFLNFWSANVGVQYAPKFYDDALLRGRGPEAAQPTSVYTNWGISSDSRRRVVGNLSGGYAHDVLGGYSKDAALSMNFRPSSNIHVNVGPSFSQLYDRVQYVGFIGDPSGAQLATLKQSTLSLDTRMDVTFSPTLSFVAYVQPFISAGHYDEFKQYLTPGQFDFRPVTIDPANSPDFNFRSFLGNGVLRWDYRPGSAFYLVWQQSRSDYEPFVGDFQTRRDLGAAFRAPARNVFAIKATYWLAR